MDEELIAFVKDLDRCWMERRFENLPRFIANDVVMVAPGGKHRTHGIEAAIESYREFMSRCEVKQFQTSGYAVTELVSTAVVEYDWDMEWSDQGTEYVAKGREILMLTRQPDGWRVNWRTQIPA